MRPILLLEINEIPWRLLDVYLKEERYPNIRFFFSKSETYTTVAVDTGELSPWVTWPTFHRGMGNEFHEIKNLGQDIGTFKGVPIWEEYRRKDHSIGICGSLQSWPPSDPGPNGFYVPDTFAHDASCYPKYLEPFQRFNLDQVSRNGRVIRKQSFFRKETWLLLKSLPKLGISVSTLWRIILQLIGERFTVSWVAKRPIFQAVLQWDLFKSLFNPKNPPAFSTFFTNHVAGLMHRYWNHIFPEDFGGNPGDFGQHKHTLDYAMSFLDEILGEAISFCEANPDLILVFATSMGQNAVHRQGHHGYEAAIIDSSALMKSCGLVENQFKPLLAMMPQIAVEIPDSKDRTRMIEYLSQCRTQGGKALFKVQEIGNSISVTIGTPKKSDVQHGGFYGPRSESRDAILISWEKSGIQMNAVDPGTGYHIPEGILAKFDLSHNGNNGRKALRADEAKSKLMEWAELSATTAKPLEILEKA